VSRSPEASDRVPAIEPESRAREYEAEPAEIRCLLRINLHDEPPASAFRRDLHKCRRHHPARPTPGAQKSTSTGRADRLVSASNTAASATSIGSAGSGRAVPHLPHRPRVSSRSYGSRFRCPQVPQSISNPCPLASILPMPSTSPPSTFYLLPSTFYLLPSTFCLPSYAATSSGLRTPTPGRFSTCV
jgi:hypothetical protein